MESRSTRIEPDFRKAEGLAEPSCQVVTDDRFYLEYLSPDGLDTIYHLFALPEYQGPWAPPDGHAWMRASLAEFRAKAALPYSDDAPWCSAQWDTEALPELVHFAVRSVDDIVGNWLLSLGIEQARITGGELLRKMQEHMFPKDTPRFLGDRLALLDRLRTSTIRELLGELGQPIPEGEDPDENIRKALDLLVPMKPGVWSIAFRELQDRVVDHKVLAESFLGCLIRAS